MTSETIHLAADGATATLALRGAEPIAWTVGGRDLLWNRDPEHWAFAAPVLFPVVGASKGGVVRVDGREYPMGQHGFARTAFFSLVERSDDRAVLRLADSPDTRAQYPFAFGLAVEARLTADALSLAFTVDNPGERDLPYALGVHPGFLWPFDTASDAGHMVVFERPEAARVPEVAPGGLLARRTRPVPLGGTMLPLSRDLFSEALVFLDAGSRRVDLRSPTGATVGLEVDGFPHLAVWSRPTAPFLSLEAWTGHADWEDAAGDLAERASMIHLPPGETRRHRVAMRVRPAA